MFPVTRKKSIVFQGRDELHLCTDPWRWNVVIHGVTPPGCPMKDRAKRG